MISQSIALSNWNNGVIMIAVFAFVCAALVFFLVKSMSSNDRNKGEEPKER
ncbi:hypothetical protein Q4512_10865 [Oceanihabitans sp. 2_MG-2023]|uniref:hypothetical protein n=1 Tax=Oceanihabitans sp. 2_MG-2023 TaxID=3062661 RepID=UPI0026E2D881|nr:hypothetical protein [Oceanihabitans sp. 2_MG-2023]MDO6597416.1 hypothetical protein [Oceanihabitans sp. 2_MG-2023]